MAEFVTLMPEALSSTTLVQEQYAFALNRRVIGKKQKGFCYLLIEKKDHSSETYGILGRVYKDRWEKAYKTEEKETDEDDEFHVSDAYLNQAIDAYLKGFESDSRDTYPGINASYSDGDKKRTKPRRIESHSCSKIFSTEKDCKGQI